MPTVQAKRFDRDVRDATTTEKKMNFDEFWNSLPEPEIDPTPERDRMIAHAAWDAAIASIPRRASDIAIEMMRNHLRHEPPLYADAADAVLLFTLQGFNAELRDGPAVSSPERPA